jgi:hypothetical protein
MALVMRFEKFNQPCILSVMYCLIFGFIDWVIGSP